MPRGGPPTYTYSLPAIYLAIPGTLITAAQHNTPLEDIASTLNTAWPVNLGGTGGTSKQGAIDSLFDGTTYISDADFRLAASADPTKLLAFNLSGITTATTRTITVPNGTGTLSLLSLAETFSGVKTFSAIPVLSGGGIRFPSTQVPSGDANTLDDYEEGTFTPTVKGTVSAGSGTYSAQEGRYTKIGDVVYFKLLLSWSASTGTGNLSFGGLPFNAASDTGRAVVSIVASNVTLTASNTIVALKTALNNDISAEQMPVGGGSLSAVALDTAGTALITGEYWV